MHPFIQNILLRLTLSKRAVPVTAATSPQVPAVQNIRELVTAMPRSECFIGTSGQKIVLPEIFYDATARMCADTANETRGMLVCKLCPNDMLLVQSILTTGTGSSIAVFVAPAKAEAVRQLALRHPEMIFIEFHSHTTATNVNDNFSGQDMVSLANAFNRHNAYQHVLFTPTHICTFGGRKPRFCIARISGTDDSDLTERFQQIQNEFKSLVAS